MAPGGAELVIFTLAAIFSFGVGAGLLAIARVLRADEIVLTRSGEGPVDEVRGRLSAVALLRDDGLITADEAAGRRAEILAEI